MRWSGPADFIQSTGGLGTPKRSWHGNLTLRLIEQNVYPISLKR